MAMLETITVGINVTIPEETLNKCVNIIKMADKPAGVGGVVAVIGDVVGYYAIDFAHFDDNKLLLTRIGDFPYREGGKDNGST